MARKFLGSVPTEPNHNAQKQQVDAAYPFTQSETAPTPTKFGHRWLRPSTSVESVWTSIAGGSWVASAGGGGGGMGLFGFSVVNGDLILEYVDGDTPPNFQIVDGDLTFTF